MTPIQTQITEKYGKQAWDDVCLHVQEIARGIVTVPDIESLTGLTHWQARTISELIKEQIIVPESRIFSSARHKYQRWLLVPDVHRPYHNKILWDKLLQLMYDMGSEIYGLIMMGDYLDAYTVGSYNNGSLGKLQGRTLGLEYDEGSKGLDQVDEALNSEAQKVFLFGNHEDRFRRLVLSGDNAKFGSALKDPTEGLRLYERGYEVLDNYGEDYYLLGNHLEAIHGDYTNKYCAEKHQRMSGGSVIFGHSHTIQSYHSGDNAAFSIGWLGDRESPAFSYTSRLGRSKWTNGFAFVYIDDNGYYYVDQIVVWNNSFFINGKKY